MQYRGNESTKFISRLLKIGAPIEPIYTMVKTRHALPSTKPPVNKMFRSNLIYQIECSGCKSKYVGLTRRHLISRVNEHFPPNGTMTKHCQSFGCNIDNPLEATSILDSSYRNIIHLVYMRLFISEKSTRVIIRRMNTSVVDSEFAFRYIGTLVTSHFVPYNTSNMLYS